MFKTLEVKLGFSAHQIGVKYKEFMKKHPTGEMTKEEFIEASKQLGDMKRCMEESLFRVFDEDDSGTMDFGEFMIASNCTNMSSPKGKLEWIFRVFDEDGEGSIDIDEAIRLLACVLDILEVIDVDGDGEITRDEFVTNALKSGFIQNLLDEKEDTEDEMQVEDVLEEEERCEDDRENETDENDE